jgi:hypothetical protein
MGWRRASTVCGIERRAGIFLCAYRGPLWYTACMLIQASAEVPLTPGSLGKALRAFALFVRDYLVAAPGAEIALALGETGARGNDVLARTLPANTKEFALGRLPGGSPLTASQFRRAVASDKPKKTRSQVRVSAEVIPDLFSLLDGLASSLPESGRGIMLLIHLSGWKFGNDLSAVAVDAIFSRFRHGAHDISASIGLRFHAMSLKDPVVAQTVTEASKRVNLRFGKPIAGFGAIQNGASQLPEASDPRLRTPAPEQQLLVLLSFEEAMARAADQMRARAEDLANIPLLFSRSGGFGKRMHDVRAGKKENVNLVSHLKRFMKERFADYRFDAADPEQLWFRKSAAPTLDLLLMFDKVHQWGLGKTFSINFAADFPNTPFGGMHTAWGGTRKNIFWLFHQGWEQQVWAYTTGTELVTALEGCGELLGRMLPALEEQCHRLLLPPPTTLPSGITERGPLSAREAYETVLPMACEWAGDAKLESIGSSSLMTISGQLGSVCSSITEGGRLRAQGKWGFKFVSMRLDRYCHYVVPHTGRVWWNFYPVLQGAIPKYSAVLESDDWIDSTAVASRAFETAKEQLEGFRIREISLALRDPTRYGGKFVWEASCIAYGASLSERRDITLHFDHHTGETLVLRGR